VINSRSVSDLEDQPSPLPRASGPDDCAKRPGNPTLASDYLADVVFRDVQPEDESVVTLLLLDADRVWIVDELSREVLEELRQASWP
jgi:hypothetical protein